MRALIGVGLALVTATCLLATVRDPHETALVWDVCPEGCPYKRIQPALNAAAGGASPETAVVVMVSPGTYRENLTIGSPGSINQGHIKLAGFSRESVRIIGLDPLVPTITINGRTNEVRDLTVIASGNFSAVKYTNTQENRSKLDNLQIECINNLDVPTGCVDWDTQGVAGTEPQFEMYNTTIRYGRLGAVLRGGTVRTANNLLKTLDNYVSVAGSYGYWWILTTAGLDEYEWYSWDEIIEVNKDTSGGSGTIYGIALTGLQAGAQTYIYNATVEVTDLTTEAAQGIVCGIGVTGNAAATAVDRCFNCDVTVSRPNSDFTTSAGFNSNGANASTYLLYGGRWRASSSAGGANDLDVGAFGILGVESDVDFVTWTGNLAAPVGAADYAKNLSGRGDVILRLSADTDSSSATEHPALHLHEDGNAHMGQLSVSGAAGVDYVAALVDAIYLLGAAGIPIQLATGSVARLTILSTGEIGINTANPLAGTELEVVGTTRVTAPAGQVPLTMPALAGAPPACGLGDFYVDSSGAFCACTAAGVWTNFAGAGTCV